MGSLFEAIVEESHGYRATLYEGQGVRNRFELEEPVRIVARTRHFGAGHFECVVRKIDLQRHMDRADPGRAIHRQMKETQTDEDKRRIAESRARQMVRAKCLQMGVNRLVTFTTRAILPWDTLAHHFELFRQRYERMTGEKWEYVAVPEDHEKRGPNGEIHWHLHVAVNRHFKLSGARDAWWDITSADMQISDGEGGWKVNGNIHVKAFHERRFTQDPVGAIASYISKYIGKRLVGDFGKKRYWASRQHRVETHYRILKAASWDEVMAELRQLYGIVDFAPIVLFREGHFYSFGIDRGFWFRISPGVKLEAPPF